MAHAYSNQSWAKRSAAHDVVRESHPYAVAAAGEAM